MTRSELINELVLRNPCFSQNVIEDAVRLMLDRITEALADGDKIEIRGFGSLTVRKRRARSGRNPSTGKIVEIGETKVVNFRTGRELRERVDISNHPEAAESLEKAKRLRSERAAKSAERRAKGETLTAIPLHPACMAPLMLTGHVPAGRERKALSHPLTLNRHSLPPVLNSGAWRPDCRFRVHSRSACFVL